MKLLFQLILVISLAPVSTSLFSQPVIIDVTTTPADCNGSATGTVTFSITGGAKPYYYYIIKGGVPRSSPQTSDTVYTFTDVSAGTYLCIVEDNNSMNDFRNRTVSQPPPIQITSVILTPISCTGFADGKINVTASGESGSYNFLLKPDGLSTITGSFEDRSPGNYRVVVSDATGCLSKDSTDILTFTDPDPISITSENKTNITCNGANNGTITIGASGGTGTYTYIISPGGTSNQTGHFTDLGPNTYTVEVTDGNTCPSATSIPLTITQPDPLQYTLQTSTNASCSGVNDGTITVAASGGTTPYRFTLSPGGTFNDDGLFTGLAPGNYTISLTDANSCGPVASIPFNITQPGPITITGTTFSDITCFNFNNGEIHVTASGGNAPLTYTLNPGADSRPDGDFTGLSEGSYTITVTDTKGCAPAVTPAINIVNPPDITLNPPALTQITCNGAANGIISVTANGGTGTLHYTLNPTAITNTSGTFTGRGPGDYTVSVTDDNTCPQKTTGTLTITQPDPLQYTLQTSTNASCSGVNDGTITVAASGGTTPYRFTLSPGGTFNDDGLFTGLAPGNYTISLTDANSCGPVASIPFNITQPGPITITGTTFSDITCFNFNNGEIHVTASGGNAPLTYTLNPGADSRHDGDFTGLSEGSYTITVTDTKGCAPAVTPAINIVNPPDITLNPPALTQITCNGAANGIISVTANGGTGTLHYTLNPTAITNTSGTFAGRGPGDYTVSVTDDNTCPQKTTGTLTITQPDPLQYTLQTSTNASCSGVNDGTITVAASGGTTPYRFTLSPGGTFNDDGLFTGLAPGNYTISLTDANSCGPVASIPFNITQPGPITITGTTFSDITCFNFNNGEIHVTASGGNAPLTYTLNPDADSRPDGDFTGLSEGSYTITVTDTKGCAPAVTPAINIVNPPDITLNPPALTQITCNGAANGIISVTANGGTGTLHYTLNPTAITNTSGTFTGRGPGDYTVSVTDDNTCPQKTTGTLTITQPDPLEASTDGSSKLSVSCYGDKNGSVYINVTGGTTPYTYSWTGPDGFTSPDKDITGLAPGEYNLSITDANSCIASYTPMATITEPDPLQMSLAKTDVVCNGQGNGTITVTASGGTPPYQYSRNGITYQASNIFNNLSKNTYTVYVRDNNSCIKTDVITIDEPDKLLITSEIRIDGNLCHGDTLGEIRILNVNGGVTPYQYSIDGGLTWSSSPIFNNLPAGSYQTVVKDFNECMATGNLNNISQPSPIRIDDYAQTDVTVCYTSLNGQIVIEASGGTGSKSYSLDEGIPNTTGIFTGVSGGNHTITISDENNCINDTVVYINHPAPLIFTSFTVTDVTGCTGDSNGAVSAVASGGTGSIVYRINGGTFQADGTFTGLAAGNHTLTIIDDNNCIKDSIFNISEPDPLVISSLTKEDISCSGDDNGTITVIAAGGTSPYTFTLNPSAEFNNDGLFTALAQGTYTVSITDNEGCGPVESSPVTINEPALLSIDSVRWTDISCTGDANGTISIYASGGTPTFTYSIDNGVSFLPGSDFSNIGPGTYTPLVKDNSACEAGAAPVVLTDPAPLTPVAEASTDVTDCFGNLNGSLAYEVSGGTGAIQYSYDGISWQADGVFTGMGGGTYIVTAKDANNCTLNSGELIINQPDQITATITGTPWYNEFKQGIITISNVAGGTGSYEFSINGMAGPFTSQTSYTGLEAGIYDVIVRDGNNCTYIQPVTISSVPSLDVTLSITASTCNGYDDAVILITVNDATGPVEYSIDDSLTWHANNEFAGLAPGTYYIAVKEESGRYFTDIVSVYEPLPLDILSDITSATCNRYSPDGEVIITVTGGTGTMSYQWADGPVTKDRSGLDAGSYTLTVTDQNGCETTEIITMPAKTNVTASAGADTIVCEGSTIILDGQGGSIFSWSPAEGLSNPGIPNPAVTVTSEVSYILTAVGTNDCYDTDTITIGIYPKLGLSAGNDTTVIKNNPVNLNATGGPYVSYQWNPATGLDNTITPDPVAAPPASQTYVVTAVDEHGCVENDTVTITIIENIVIYSSFSPNDDGINDFWDIDNAEYYPDILVEVFNRWGEKLFSSKGYTAGKRWDGYHKGKKVPIGTYYYVVIPYKGASALTGPLTIIR